MRGIVLCVLVLAFWVGAAAWAAEGADAMKMYIKTGEDVLSVDLADNSSAQALAELLRGGDLTLEMEDYAGMEKIGQLPHALPRNDEPMNTTPGDVVLYLGRTLCVYYGTNSWSLTPIGKVANTDPQRLRAFLGSAGLTVTLSLSK